MVWWRPRAQADDSHPKKHPRTVPDYLQVPWHLRDGIIVVVAWFALQYAIVFALYILAGFSPVILHFVNSAAAGNNIVDLFIVYLLDAAAGFAVVAWYLRHYRVTLSAVGWRKFSIVKMVIFLVLALLAFIVAVQVLLWLVAALVPSFNPSQPQNNQFVGVAGQSPSLAIVALVLIPPILEETIFRGFVFPAFAKRWGVVWGAVASSVIFGLAHGQANISVYTFLLGCVLCFMYVKLRSIVPGMFLHMLNNYLAFLAAYHK